MSKINNIVSVSVIALCLMTVILVYIAGKNSLFDLEENRCEMTWMFEWPEYIRIKLKKRISGNYPRYGLYVYGEGEYAQDLRRSKPEGIPVLFIPGNAGSYRQVRSLASVALRKAETHRNHFNYFTIDFDEDFSGLYGGVLMDQVNFVHSCLKHIIRMYKGNTNPPESVIVIGHSMGGIIARALFTLDNFESNLVSLIITLGTPHLAPVIPFDSHLNTFYHTVNNFWKSNPTVGNISVVSFAGGARDILVPARYCSLPRNAYTDLHYSAVTTDVPDIWLTIDHLALCWCKQLILVINRALFTLIDNNANRITNDRLVQARVFRRFFGILHKGNEETIPESRNDKSPTIYREKNLWNNFEEISISGTLLIPIDTDRDGGQFIALSKSLGDISIKSCKSVEDERCKEGSFQALLTSDEKAGFVYLSNLTSTGYIMISSLKDDSRLTMQFLRSSDINRHYDKFRMFSGVQKFSTTNNMFINISLPMIRNCFDVYLITVEEINCENDNGGILAGRIHVPWFKEDVYARPPDSSELSILLKIHTSKPTTDSEPAQLQIWKTSKCSLEVTIVHQFTQTLGRIFILYAPLIPRWIYFWILITLVLQLRQMANKGISLSIWSTVVSYKLPIFIPVFSLISREFIATFLKSSLGWSDQGLLLYDWMLPSSFIILVAFLIFISIHLILEIIQTSVARLLLVCLSEHIQPSSQTSTTGIVLLYSILALVIFCLTAICSSLAIYVLTMVIFIRNSHSKATMKSRRLLLTNLPTSAEVVNKLNLSKLLLVLFLLVSFQTTPAFIVWLKVLSTSLYVPSDPFVALVVLLTPTVVCLLEMNIYKPSIYASYIILSMWFVGFLLNSLDRLPHVVGFILLAVDFFVFVKNSKHEKDY